MEVGNNFEGGSYGLTRYETKLWINKQVIMLGVLKNVRCYVWQEIFLVKGS